MDGVYAGNAGAVSGIAMDGVYAGNAGAVSGTSPWTACMPEMQEQFPALRAPGQADGDRETAHKWRR
jgi:hypothetical protein